MVQTDAPRRRGRFAPSPTGPMHLGNARTALLAWLDARAGGGRIVLRIEDLDPLRSRRMYADLNLRDLAWLGLDYDEGPFYQGERGARYAAVLEDLQARDLVYPCWCSRADLAAGLGWVAPGERAWPRDLLATGFGLEHVQARQEGRRA